MDSVPVEAMAVDALMLVAVLLFSALMSQGLTRIGSVAVTHRPGLVRVAG